MSLVFSKHIFKYQIALKKSIEFWVAIYLNQVEAILS